MQKTATYTTDASSIPTLIRLRHTHDGRRETYAKKLFSLCCGAGATMSMDARCWQCSEGTFANTTGKITHHDLQYSGYFKMTEQMYK